VLVGLLLLGALLRLGGWGSIPPGLYHDEAQNGVDATGVLEGNLPLYFEANNGREPLFIYLVALAVGILGRNPLAVRLPSFYIGMLTLAAVYDLGRTLWGRRAGRYALAILAVTLWHVHLSRIGFRAVLLPLTTALILGQAVRGARSGRLKHWALAGAWYGLSWYTYLAARFTPVPIALLAVYGLLLHRAAALKLRRQIAVGCLVALVVLLPLGIYTVQHPELMLQRGGQVSIWSEEINQGDFWGTLADHVGRALGMFFVRGDRIWRHNLAWRPVWDPALGVACAIGIGVLLAGFTGSAGAALVLIWTLAMSIPTVLAEDTPHFLRAVGMLPTAVFLPTMGLMWLREHLKRYPWGRLVPAVILGAGLASTSYSYFVSYAAAPETYHWFEAGPVAMAGRINQALETGWDGARLLHGSAGARTVTMDRQLWQSWTAVSWMVPEAQVRFLPLAEPVELREGVTFIVWPYRNWEPDVLPALPHPAYLHVEQGPQAQGDLDPDPFTIAVIIEADPLPEVPAAVARFERGIELSAALVRVTEQAAEVRLWWNGEEELDSDYVVFVHYLRSGELIAQHDGQPGYGHLRTTLWQPGDLILDSHPLSVDSPDPATDALRIGLYRADTGTALSAVNAQGEPVADWVEIGVILEVP